MIGDAILRLAAMPITPVAVPITIRQRDTIANDPSYRTGLSHIERDHTLLEIALLYLFLRKSIPVPVTYWKQHIIRVNGFYEARARRGFATVVRSDQDLRLKIGSMPAYKLRFSRALDIAGKQYNLLPYRDPQDAGTVILLTGMAWRRMQHSKIDPIPAPSLAFLTGFYPRMLDEGRHTGNDSAHSDLL